MTTIESHEAEELEPDEMSQPEAFEPDVMGPDESEELPGLLSGLTTVFVFLIPFEGAIDLSGGNASFTLTKFVGLALFLVALLKAPGRCFAKPKAAVWLFASYLIASILRAVVSPEPLTRHIAGAVTVLQGILCMWILSNLLTSIELRTRMIRAMMLSTACIGTLSLFGMTVSEGLDMGGRETIFGNDPNYMAYILCIGLIACMDCIASEKLFSPWTLVAFASTPLMLERIAATGSRGGSVAAALGVVALGISHWSSGAKIKVLVSLVLIGGLGVTAFQSSEVSQRRWQRVVQDRNISGRDVIYSSCMEMISEKPLLGWGPAHLSELARREGKGNPIRDTHGDLLWTMTESGAVGGGLFGAGLALCVFAALSGRRNLRSQAAVALVVATMAFGATCTAHRRKSFWVAMAFACAVPTVIRRIEDPTGDPVGTAQD